MAVFGLFMGMIRHVLTWTNELMPIKQSMAVVVTMFGGFVYAFVMFMGYMMLSGWTLGYVWYMCIFIAANAVIGAVLYMWLRTKGCTKFAGL